MTNYERLFQEQMQDPKFATAYHEAQIERLLDEMLTTLKEKIFHDEPKENLLNMIDAIQQQLHTGEKYRVSKTSRKTAESVSSVLQK